MREIRLGYIVTIPSGERGQVDEIREYWKNIPCTNRIVERRELLFNPMKSKRKPFWVADYMITGFQQMPECEG